MKFYDAYRYIMEMPHVELPDGDVIDLHLEDVPQGDINALKVHVHKITKTYKNPIRVIQTVLKNPITITVLRKRFDISPEEFLALFT